MEKTPSSVSIGNIRGEMTWMPEKASACNRTSGAKAPEFFTLFGTAEAVPSRASPTGAADGDAEADGFCVATIWGAQPGMAVPLERRPRS